MLIDVVDGPAPKLCIQPATAAPALPASAAMLTLIVAAELVSIGGLYRKK